MPHSNFKERSQAFNTGIGKCSCGQIFDFASERDQKMKLRLILSSVKILQKVSIRWRYLRKLQR